MLRSVGLIATLLTTPSVAAHAQAAANEDQAVRDVVNAYLHGLKFNDVESLRRAFWPEVGESQRGCGIGKRLVAAAVAFAEEAGCARIVVGTAEHRAGAHAFYESIGWEYTGRRFARLLSRHS